MTRIVITETEPTYITRRLTEEFFDQAKNWCCDCEVHSIHNCIRHIDIYTDAWTIDETFLIKITFNNWKNARKYAKRLSWLFSMSTWSEVDIYREKKSLFLRLLF